MSRRTPVVGGLVGGLVGLVVALGLGVRPLDVRLEASSVELGAVDPSAGALVLQRDFLDAVDHVELFHAGDAAGKRLSRIAGGQLEGRVALGPIGCGALRFEGSRPQDGNGWGVSLHVEPTPPAESCRLPVGGLADADGSPPTLVQGDRLDFILESDASTPAAPTSLEILGNAPTGTLTALLSGKIDGLSDAHACEWGRHVSFAGVGLHVAWLVARIGTGVPRLELWARARLPTKFDADGSHCVVALYDPKWLWPVLLIGALAAAGWKVANWLAERKNSGSPPAGPGG